MAISQRWMPERWGMIRSWLAPYRLLLSLGKSLDPPGTGPTARTQRAEVEEFEAFLHHYERQILNYLWRMTADEQTAYDLCQETFLRAWQHFAKISTYEQPRAWLFHVATNLALNFRRNRAEAIPTGLLDEGGSGTGSDPITHFVESDLVRQTLQELPPRRRAALILREVYGLTAEEVAQVLGMTSTAVKMTLSRSREQFRQAYTKEAQS